MTSLSFFDKVCVMNKLKFLMLILTTNLCLLSPLLCAQQKRIIPIGNFQALGSYSDTNKGANLWGYNLFGSYAPSVKLNDSQFFIPLYNGSFKRMRQYITQEEGARFYNTSQTHNLSIALRTQHDDDWASRVTGLATWSFLKETQDESFGRGLYDYRDFGASFDLRQTLTVDETKQHNYSWGIQYFRRTYPNFKSLISLATVTAPETDEKNFDGIRSSFGVEENVIRGISWEFKPSLLLKYFTDKKLIGDDGVLKSGDKRRDYVLSGDLNTDWPFKEGRWVLSADNTVSYNHSNLDFYDSRDTLTLSDDVFTKNYYTYFTAFAYPYITYYHPMGKDKKFALRGGYSFSLRDYPGRRVQEENGAYADTKQRDKEHAVHFSSSYPITKELFWVAYFDYSRVRSNQKYEKFYLYTYNVYQIQTGISVEF